MALTVTSVATGPGAGAANAVEFMAPTRIKMGLYTITFDSSYPNTGGTVGEPFTDVSSDFREVLGVIQVNADSNIVVTYAAATDELRLFLEDDTSGIYAQAANGTNQSGISCTLLVIGY